jgi:hypothetical protein
MVRQKMLQTIVQIKRPAVRACCASSHPVGTGGKFDDVLIILFWAWGVANK